MQTDYSNDKAYMKRFLVKISSFLLLVIVLTSVLYAVSDFLIKQKKQQLLKIRDDINIVFAGDSNVEGAVNDSLISNSINIAQSGEAYLYSFVKIKSLTEINKQIHTIYLGFSFHDIVKSTEERWLFQDQFVMEKIKNYNYLLGNPEKKLIFKHNPKAYIKGCLQCIINNFKGFIKSYSSKKTNNKINNFGGYEYNTRYKLRDDIKINAFTGQHSDVSLVQDEYLKMISRLCRQKAIRLILFDTPKNKYYASRFDEETKNNWLSIRKSMMQDSLLDLSELSFPDSCYYDMDHLNCKGAGIFSEYLNEELHYNKSEALTKEIIELNK
jgi:hypothetical protein